MVRIRCDIPQLGDICSSVNVFFGIFPLLLPSSLYPWYEAFRVTHAARFSVRVAQHEVVDQVRKHLSCDRDSQLAAVREVRLARFARLVLLRKEHFLGRTVGCPPLLDPTLQRPSLN